MVDFLEKDSDLTKFEYEYLSGKWVGVRGAAWNVIAEWCHNHGYGQFDSPTPRGIKAMEKYEGRF